jgi:hypothetical protein
MGKTPYIENSSPLNYTVLPIPERDAKNDTRYFSAWVSATDGRLATVEGNLFGSRIDWCQEVPRLREDYRPLVEIAAGFSDRFHYDLVGFTPDEKSVVLTKVFCPRDLKGEPRRMKKGEELLELITVSAGLIQPGSGRSDRSCQTAKGIAELQD